MYELGFAVLSVDVDATLSILDEDATDRVEDVLTSSGWRDGIDFKGLMDAIVDAAIDVPSFKLAI